MKARPGKRARITDGIVDKLGETVKERQNGRRDIERRPVQEIRRAENMDAFSPQSQSSSLALQLSFNNLWARYDKWEGKGKSAREKRLALLRGGYAGELKSLHASTVMYGDCACVTRLACELCHSVVPPCDAGTLITTTLPLSRYRNGHRYLVHARVHAAVIRQSR